MPKPEDLEIEHKFLVDLDWSRTLADGRSIVQGYLLSASSTSVRVRLVPSASIFMLTVKGPREGDSRREIEQEIPQDMAEMLLDSCGDRIIEKTRYLVVGDVDGKPWVVDIFHRLNEGLIMAEIELDQEGETFSIPSWATTEVTDDERYYNEYLSDHPFSSW